ncbi:GH116 family glycosyl-hydrolase, partial [Alkalinema pantanalense CENA528]|uniref:GH116 family glycosyl-hydrolase n=1 Tax=Alkalinema pantanalense TaxID=1620705 RepID=UPI003D6EC00B
MGEPLPCPGSPIRSMLKAVYFNRQVNSVLNPVTMAAVNIPSCAWRRSIGQGWDNPYTVRYPSNLDDGPWHGAPLGGFGAGCIGRGSNGQFNLWHIDGGEHVFQNFAGCQFSIFESTQNGTQAYALATAAPDDGSLSAWQWYPPTLPP